MHAFFANACDLNEYLVKPGNVLALEKLTFSIFHVTTLILFIFAIIHTLSAAKITAWAKKIEKRHKEKYKDHCPPGKEVCFLAEIVYFFGEVELIFGLWAIPLVCVISYFYNWKTAVEYISTRDFTEPLFVVVVMSLAGTKPIFQLAKKILSGFASIFSGSVSAWWISIITLGPILGSLITEVGAMTLCALLLSQVFFSLGPSTKLSYATLGLLFTNISVGGILTNFAAPPVLIIARCWEWSSWHMLSQFGVKAVLGICIGTLFYYLFFRKEFARLEKKRIEKEASLDIEKEYIPFWITAVHILFIVWVIAHSHYAPIFVASFLFFLGFHRATKPYQNQGSIRRPILVGFFLAGLIIHGGLQGWWITPMLSNLHHFSVMGLGVILTAINDNAAVTYLTSLIPEWTEAQKYAIISGVVTGGGLTVIANAPNPAGYVLLSKHFSKGISPFGLFVSALFPTVIFFILFALKWIL
jgi:hypothetical protein